MGLTRRRFVQTLAAGGAGAVASAQLGCRDEPAAPPWDEGAIRRPPSSIVAIAAVSGYGSLSAATVREVLRALDVDVRGLRVVIKPNIVEGDETGRIITRPEVVGAIVEAVRTAGARSVRIGEGPGHWRDTDAVLLRSGYADILRGLDVGYTDLNLDAVGTVQPVSRYMGHSRLYLPRTVLDADLLITVPRMKTHHWAGMTCAMKNLFGIAPGSIYGWPKNVLHWAGIDNSIIDINAALPVRTLAIVDGIQGMEGDGPLNGTPVDSGVLVAGTDLVAVDATCARLMNLEPERIGYLAEAGRFLGNVQSDAILQVGESIETHARDYRSAPGMGRVKPAALPALGAAGDRHPGEARS